MLFDQVRDLPVATLRPAPRGPLARAARDLRGWAGERWAWLRPRRVPVLAALLGMLATVSSVNYLANPPAPPLRRAVAPAAGVIHVDGQPYRDGKPLGELPTAGYRVRVVVAQ